MAKQVDIDELFEEIREYEELDDISDVRELVLYGSYRGRNSFEHIDKEGGGEGGGEHVEAIFKFKEKLYKVVLSYASYEGYFWDYAEAFEVVPVERLVTFYE